MLTGELHYGPALVTDCIVRTMRYLAGCLAVVTCMTHCACHIMLYFSKLYGSDSVPVRKLRVYNKAGWVFGQVIISKDVLSVHCVLVQTDFHELESVCDELVWCSARVY